MSPGTRLRRAARRVGRGLLLVVALYLVGRAVVEVATVDPAHPETYRLSWGGPHYLGVVLVHAGPGVLVLVLAAAHRRRRSRAAQPPASR